VSAGDDGTVRIWDVTPNGGRDLLTIEAHHGGVDSIYYNPAGTQFQTTGTSDGKAKVWDARTGRLLSSYRTETDPGVSYMSGSGFPPQINLSSPDEKYGIDLHEGRRANLRLNATGEIVARIGNYPQSAAFDPSSRILAIGNADGTVLLWSIPRHRAIRTFSAQRGYVEAMEFSPDGSLLATAGEDTTTRLWDMRTGSNVLTLTGHTRLVDAVAFSPNGSQLATGGRDGTVRVYVLPIDQLVAVARSRLTQGWTPATCRQYLASSRCPAQP
jgi:WD40 repeat protein